MVKVRGYVRRIRGKPVRVKSHVRRIFTKRTTNRQYRNMDSDKDGVRNIDDCRPFDKNKQDWFGNEEAEKKKQPKKIFPDFDKNLGQDIKEFKKKGGVRLW